MNSKVYTVCIFILALFYGCASFDSKSSQKTAIENDILATKNDKTKIDISKSEVSYKIERLMNTQLSKKLNLTLANEKLFQKFITLQNLNYTSNWIQASNIQCLNLLTLIKNNISKIGFKESITEPETDELIIFLFDEKMYINKAKVMIEIWICHNIQEDPFLTAKFYFEKEEFYTYPEQYTKKLVELITNDDIRYSNKSETWEIDK
jgi:hypothetical protein